MNAKYCFVLLIWMVTARQASTFAQDSPIINRQNIKLCHSMTPQFSNWNNRIELRNLRAEYNYGINSYMELGGYIGYNRFDNIMNPKVSSSPYRKSNAFFYGINSNLHLLPFIFMEDEIRFDLYLAAKLGAISLFAPEGSRYRGHQPDYGLSGGLAFYLTKKWGIYAEYGYSRTVNNTKYFRDAVKAKRLEPNLRYGISIKF